MEAASSATGASLPSGEIHRLRPGKLLGDVICEMGLATREQVEQAVVAGRAAGKRVGEMLVHQKVITADDLARAVAQRFGLPRLNVANVQVEIAAAGLLEPEVARRMQALPIAFGEQDTLIVAMVEPSNVLAVDDIAMITGHVVRAAIVSAEELEFLINKISRLDAAVSEVSDTDEVDTSGQRAEEELSVLSDDAPAVRVVRSIIAEAMQRRASDIHLEPSKQGIRVRYRVDGVMQNASTIPPNMGPSVVSRIKVIAELDIAERRKPQDGRVGLKVDGRSVDLRVVTVPLVEGESVVLRILDVGSEVLRLEDIGMSERARIPLLKALHSSSGGILTTGPTGSGKTTTLYAALATILSDELTLMTIEDPVEYRLAGIKQVQVNPKAGLTFASGLRAAMRADPDVIMVGEIRDPESAGIAVQAAITGHLVLSTLHTNDAATTVTRLVEMGIPPYLVASAITCVVGQRLARRLCPTCRTGKVVPAESIGMAGGGEVEIFEPNGCTTCGESGYRGRIGIYEVMPITETLRRLATERADAETLARAAVEEGMVRMRDDALEKVRMGLTSMAEVLRVTNE